MSTATLSPKSAAHPVSDHPAHIQAFCSAAGAEAFHSIVGPNEIWKADPADVEAIHAEAREVFERLLNRAVSDPPPNQGRTFLLLGESGSGKTHLMRAFRHTAHSSSRGYCGYLQMTSMASNYGRYVLSKLIDSLDQPYCDPDIATSGLMRLSTGLVEAVPDIPASRLEQLHEGNQDGLCDCVADIAGRIERRFPSCDPYLIQALVFLQANDPRIKSRVLSYLRAEDLAPGDRKMLGELVPRCNEEDPQRIIIELGRIMAAVHNSSLVLLVDQLEDIFNLEKTGIDQFRRAVDVLTAISESVKTSVVVVACLEDYFAHNRQHLPGPKLARLQTNPEPFRIASFRSREECHALVVQRLQALYKEEMLSCNGLPPTFPFTPDQIGQLANISTRGVLTQCLRHQQKCAAAGRWMEPCWGPEPPAPPPVPGLEQEWNDFHAVFKAEVPDQESQLARLVKWAVEQVSGEVTSGHWFSAETDGHMIPIEIHGPENSVHRVVGAICNKRPQGGGLSKQIGETLKRAGELPVALLRSTAYPKSGKTIKDIGRLVARGGKKLQVEDADWRRILALKEFHSQQGGRPEYQEWLEQFQPLSQLPFLGKLLDLDKLRQAQPGTNNNPQHSAPPPNPPVPILMEPTQNGSKALERGLLQVGFHVEKTSEEVTLDSQELKQHAAFLGASGSGKTTAALNLIEQLLLQGIPAILVDRKGDLCRYADPRAWDEPPAEGVNMECRKRLRDRLDVAVYTPGSSDGRPLALPIMSEGVDRLPTTEREQLAGYAAEALGRMLDYRSRADMARLAILRKAIEVLSAKPGITVSVAALQKLVESEDDTLLAAVGGFDNRQYHKLAEELLALQINYRQLLEVGGEQLNIDTLLGRDSLASGRTRLSVISTRFLPDAATTEFWVAQLLAALNRWVGKSPSAALQAVALFDEADLYLPAIRQPATKAPMENLLRRARSAGLGVLLATQSPGDFDYKCRDNIKSWIVGQVKEEVALRKLRPMFSDARKDPSNCLPGQDTGRFHLLRGKEVVALRSRPSLIRTEQLPEERILELARQPGR